MNSKILSGCVVAGLLLAMLATEYRWAAMVVTGLWCTAALAILIAAGLYVADKEQAERGIQSTDQYQDL
jgi:NAD(P)H-hydrate repair Nnr-like enzyme with NAD(P)H-hydrate dehydratase domain